MVVYQRHQCQQQFLLGAKMAAVPNRGGWLDRIGLAWIRAQVQVGFSLTLAMERPMERPMERQAGKEPVTMERQGRMECY